MVDDEESHISPDPIQIEDTFPIKIVDPGLSFRKMRLWKRRKYEYRIILMMLIILIKCEFSL